ncbi:glycosyltransferase [Klebsiella aerogenes]|uniref:Glycosyl transferase n=6 Tax=Klebsiella aerogenes TaxID=548 RepID=A0A346NSY9_KLEAE|nr:glycosyltransferase [Klebsiella aerogenes]AXR70382.1 glycosyl transferase [Klebsiella aerogenes]MEB6108036.1 glycosyltransferase [Klebsiella aerogenes]MEB6600301.1 glycosyltransferase [Klebsiella aerogenes]QDK16183.1 glycosyltransferase [Klebsiella aerogenes]QSB59833.1 glycosyltransferase [Klebsiella aerogenes]
MTIKWILGPTGRFNTGVAKYSLELIEALQKCSSFRIEVMSYNDHGKPNSINRYIWQFLTLPIKVIVSCWKHDLVIYQEAFGHIALFRLFNKRKTIIIIHHIPELNNYSVKNIYLKTLFAIITKLKNIIFVTPTDFTKKMLEDNMKVPHEKVKTVPNAISNSPQQAGLSIEEKNILEAIQTKKNNGYTIALNIGSFETRKNILVLVNTLKELSADKVYFIKAGFAINENNKIQFIEAMNRQAINFTLLDDVSSTLIDELYRQCDLYLAPSVYEGFGRTLIEAQNHECIVISSSIPSHDEIMNGTSINIKDYQNPVSWVEGIRYAISLSEEDRSKIITDGKLNAKRFLPQNVAKSFMSIV